MRQMNRIARIGGMALALSFALAPLAASSQDKWPTRPLKLVVPYAAGGPSDAAGRFIADGLTRELGQSVVVDNRPGGGASIGAAAVAKAAPDGYTFLLGHAASVSLTPQIRKVDYDPLKDLTPVAAFSSNFTLLVTRKDFGPKNMAELKALAASKPKAVSCGTAGAGSGSHIACETLADLMGAPLLVVHYKGSAEAVTDILAGRIDMMFDPSSLQHVKSGRLNVLTARGEGTGRFTSELPNVPSFAEQGYPTMTDGLWIGLMAPTGTPEPILRRLSAAIEKVTNAPDTAEKLLRFSQAPGYIDTAGLKSRIPDEFKQYTALVKKLNLRAD